MGVTIGPKERPEIVHTMEFAGIWSNVNVQLRKRDEHHTLRVWWARRKDATGAESGGILSSYRHTWGRETERPFHSDVTGRAVSAHAVQFYVDDAVFIESLSEFVGAALGAGGACIVIATDRHVRNLIEHLSSNGIEMSRVQAKGRYIALDAHDILR